MTKQEIEVLVTYFVNKADSDPSVLDAFQAFAHLILDWALKGVVTLEIYTYVFDSYLNCLREDKNE